jgi:exonuclease VII small subunit
MTTSPSDAREEITFEQQLEDLEAVLDELESGALSLEDMLNR